MGRETCEAGRVFTISSLISVKHTYVFFKIKSLLLISISDQNIEYCRDGQGGEGPDASPATASV